MAVIYQYIVDDDYVNDINTNIYVLHGVKETTILNHLKHRKLSYAGHIMRNISGHYDTLLRTVE